MSGLTAAVVPLLCGDAVLEPLLLSCTRRCLYPPPAMRSDQLGKGSCQSELIPTQAGWRVLKSRDSYTAIANKIKTIPLTSTLPFIDVLETGTSLSTFCSSAVLIEFCKNLPPLR
ncbi:hypothetical protein [Prochlorococcus sp. MIT 1303]|uniref:hypothetical protein n=1 Tax=Prochlorococcus sp. MIT 1303 TaxID=1723647 RepID=UPI000303BFE4|nr:hypothetical protein [Prochlorococcus sp. MIT 1303]